MILRNYLYVHFTPKDTVFTKAVMWNKVDVGHDLRYESRRFAASKDALFFESITMQMPWRLRSRLIKETAM